MAADPDSSIPRWEIEHSEPVVDAKIFKLRRDHSRVPGTAKTGTFSVLESPDWVNIVPVTTDGKLVLVSQFRHGTNTLSLETPGGLIEPDESPVDAAARELREETGYTAARLRQLGESDANPAFMTNRFTAVLAEDAVLTDPTAWDEHEELQLHLVPLAELPQLLRSGAIRNSYTVLALCWFLLEREGIL